jgi:hypothetical protein
VTKAAQNPPPAAPGALGVAAAPGEVLTYLSRITAWRDWLAASLGELDRRAKVAESADDLTADITLAFALWQSIASRIDEIVAAWDSGRVGAAERERISELVWGRLGGSLDVVFAVSFVEACVLADALVDRLRDRLDADALGAHGVGDAAAAVAESVERCRAQPGADGRASELRALAASVDTALADARRGIDVRQRLARLLREASALERELIVEGAAVAAIVRDTVELTDRLARAHERASAVRALAARCAEKIADPPRLAVPAPAVIGSVPATAGDWRAARIALDAFDERLQQVERALAEAEARFAAPLARRAELRGLLDAYRNMALRRGVGELPAISEAHEEAHKVLFSAPLDLDDGEAVVAYFDDTLRACLQDATPTNGADEA